MSKAATARAVPSHEEMTRFCAEIRGGFLRYRHVQKGRVRASNAISAFTTTIKGGKAKDGTKLTKPDKYSQEGLEYAIRVYKEAMDIFYTNERETAETLEAMVAGLPITEFATSIDGVSLLSVAQLIGMAGNLSNYPTHSALWKRLGLGSVQGVYKDPKTPELLGKSYDMVQQRTKNKELAKEMGFRPNYRGICHQIHDSILMASIRKVSTELGAVWAAEGGTVFVDDGVEKVVRPGAEKYVVPFIEKREFYRTTPDKEGKMRSDGHASKCAKRWMVKNFIRDFYKAWIKIYGKNC